MMEHHESAVLRQFPGEAAHDVFVIGVPAATVDDHDAREIPGAFRRINVVLEGLHTGLGVNHIIRHIDVIDCRLFDERRADTLVLVDRHFELACHSLVIHLTESAGNRSRLRLKFSGIRDRHQDNSEQDAQEG